MRKYISKYAPHQTVKISNLEQYVAIFPKGTGTGPIPKSVRKIPESLKKISQKLLVLKSGNEALTDGCTVRTLKWFGWYNIIPRHFLRGIKKIYVCSGFSSVKIRHGRLIHILFYSDWVWCHIFSHFYHI